jgi:glycosyltransferase involved in cell wall biosynthesis
VVIHQNNTGTGLARDAGIKIAKSNYLLFVDSDDWIESNALELLYNKQIETDADIVMGGFREIYQDYSIPYYFPDIESNNLFVYLFLNRCKYLVTKLYKKYLFEEYFVPITNYGEDVIVTAQLFSKLGPSKVKIIDAIIYNYDHRTDGITSRLKNQSNYLSYEEYPALKSILWISRNINEVTRDKEIKSPFLLYLILSGFIPYIKYNRNFKKNEIDKFYNTYYIQCLLKYKIKVIYRILINSFHISIELGRICVWVINRLDQLKPYFYKYYLRYFK